MEEDPFAPETGLVTGADGRARCWWGASAPEYEGYHDHEWGYPVADDHRLFEKISLEGFQSGLSWLIILRKREGFRKAFAGFDFEQVARFGEADVARLMQDTGIIRNTRKIQATIQNARQACDLAESHGSLAAYFWRFEPEPASRPAVMTPEALHGLTTSKESVALAKDLKRRGWSFVGPTTVHSFMQAMGLVNDHLDGCWVRGAALEARGRFEPPRSAEG